MELALEQFILENPNWMQLLQEEPYNLTVKIDGDYALLSYDMIRSDFSYQIVREARGIIFKISTLTPVCVPFFKFFNVQETNADEIDWSSARVTEKVDGSIIKVWFDEGWHVSTNGTIDARNASLQTPVGNIQNYFDLFFSAENMPENFFERLNENFTYIFEIVSPFNRVVVPYTTTKIYHLGARSNVSMREIDLPLGIEKPKSYRLSNLEECMQATENMAFSEEGFVVVDAKWNRVKIKSPAYVSAHHLKNNGVVTMNRVLEMIKQNGQDDFLSVYPEYSAMFEAVLQPLTHFLNVVESNWMNISGKTFDSRKDLALAVRKTICPSAIFALWDKKYHSVLDWAKAQDNDKLLQLIGVK